MSIDLSLVPEAEHILPQGERSDLLHSSTDVDNLF